MNENDNASPEPITPSRECVPRAARRERAQAWAKLAFHAGMAADPDERIEAVHRLIEQAIASLGFSYAFDALAKTTAAIGLATQRTQAQVATAVARAYEEAENHAARERAKLRR